MLVLRPTIRREGATGPALPVLTYGRVRSDHTGTLRGFPNPPAMTPLGKAQRRLRAPVLGPAAPSRRLVGLAVAGLIVFAATGRARAQDRPSEQDIFGGGATPAPTPTGSASPAPTPAEGAAPVPAAPPSGGAPAASTTPPAAAAEGTARDQSLLGNTGGTAQPLSDYIAPDNPLQIGGQVYLRAQSTAYQGGQPLSGVPQWGLSAPSLLDVYLDARPNPRVRAFVLGRMSFDPTRPLNSVNANDVIDMIKEGVMVGPANERAAEIGRQYTKRQMPW